MMASSMEQISINEQVSDSLKRLDASSSLDQRVYLELIRQLMEDNSRLSQGIEKAQRLDAGAQSIIRVLRTTLDLKDRKIAELEASGSDRVAVTSEPEVVTREVIREVPVVVTERVLVPTPIKAEVIDPKVEEAVKEKAEIVKMARKVEGISYRALRGIAQFFMMLGAALGMTVSAPFWIITGLGAALVFKANEIRNGSLIKSIKLID